MKNLKLSILFLFPIHLFAYQVKVEVELLPNYEARFEFFISQWTKGDVVFGLRKSYGDVKDIATTMQIEEVTQDRKKVNFESDGENNNFVKFKATPKPGNFSIKYKYKSPSVDNRANLKSSLTLIHDDRAIVRGMGNFLYILNDDNMASVMVTFKNLKSGKAYCSQYQMSSTSCGFRASNLEGGIQKAFYDAIIPVGTWEFKEMAVNGVTFQILRGGKWQIPFREFQEWLDGPIRFQTEKMGPHIVSSYQLIVDGIPDRIQNKDFGASGNSMYHSCYIISKPDADIDYYRQYIAPTIVHEVFHRYAWRYSNNNNEDAWFHEGLTDYMAYLSMWETWKRKSVKSDFHLGRLINNYLANGLGSPHSSLEASKVRFSSENAAQAQALIYKKPMLAAFLFDIQQKDDTRIWKPLRSLWQNYGRHLKPLDFAIIEQIFQKDLGKEKAGKFFQMIKSKENLNVEEELKKARYTIKIENNKVVEIKAP